MLQNVMILLTCKSKVAIQWIETILVHRTTCNTYSFSLMIAFYLMTTSYYDYYILSRVMRKQTFWFPTWSHTNQAVQLQKMVRGFKFRIEKVEGLYNLCSENKGADI